MLSPRNRQIVNAHIKGVSYRMISNMFGVGHKTAVDICVAELGLQAMPNKRRKKLRNPEIGVFATLCDGDSIAEIGFKLIDLPDDGCRYPTARDPHDMSQRFCGEHKHEKLSYCRAHAEVCMPSLFVAEAA